MSPAVKSAFGLSDLGSASSDSDGISHLLSALETGVQNSGDVDVKSLSVDDLVVMSQDQYGSARKELIEQGKKLLGSDPRSVTGYIDLALVELGLQAVTIQSLDSKEGEQTIPDHPLTAMELMNVGAQALPNEMDERELVDLGKQALHAVDADTKSHVLSDIVHPDRSVFLKVRTGLGGAVALLNVASVTVVPVPSVAAVLAAVSAVVVVCGCDDTHF